MRAVLLVCVLVVITKRSRTGAVGAVVSVVTDIALAEAKVAASVIRAVVDAVVEVVVPHVAEGRGLPSIVQGLRLRFFVGQTAEHDDLLGGLVVDRTVTVARQRHHVLQPRGQVAAPVVPVPTAVPPGALSTRLVDKHTAVGAAHQTIHQTAARGLCDHTGAALVESRIVGAVEGMLERLGVLHGARGGTRKQRRPIDRISIDVIPQCCGLAGFVELLLEDSIVRSDLAVGPVVLLLRVGQDIEGKVLVSLEVVRPQQVGAVVLGVVDVHEVVGAVGGVDRTHKPAKVKIRFVRESLRCRKVGG